MHSNRKGFVFKGESCHYAASVNSGFWCWMGRMSEWAGSCSNLNNDGLRKSNRFTKEMDVVSPTIPLDIFMKKSLWRYLYEDIFLKISLRRYLSEDIAPFMILLIFVYVSYQLLCWLGIDSKFIVQIKFFISSFIPNYYVGNYYWNNRQLQTN